MTRKEAILKIKELLFGKEAEEETQATVEMGSATASDGTVLQWEGDIAVGVPVFVVNEAGEAVLSGEAEYEVEGVGTITVGADGAVAEIKPVEAPADTTDEQVEQAAEEGAAEQVDETPAGDTIEERVARLEEGMQMVIDLLNEIAGEQEGFSTRMSAIEKEPSAARVGLSRQDKAEDKPTINYERRVAALEQAKKLLR